MTSKTTQLSKKGPPSSLLLPQLLPFPLPSPRGVLSWEPGLWGQSPISLSICDR